MAGKATTAKKRIVIVDGHASIRELLTEVISRDRNYKVVGQAGSGTEAIAMCANARPDLVVLDLLLPELCGVEVIRRLRAQHAPPRVLIYTGTVCKETIVEALRCRPDGFVEKSQPLRFLFDGMRAVLTGCRYFAPYASALLHDALNPECESMELSQREREILQLTADGLSSKEIATRLDIATRTVENHRQRMMAKLGVHNVAGLIRHAMRIGMVGVA
jgi:DNA-binding NarL/FixJ family response regulator